jgi:PPOX class probable F420-dependent enzyme
MLFDPADPGHVTAESRLRSEPVIWLTTVRADGQPETSPVWFLWDGESIRILSMPAAGKVRNLRTNPRVALNLDGNKLGGEIVTLEGTAELAEGEPAGEDYLAKYDEAIRSLGSDRDEFTGAYSTLVRVRPTRLRVY